MDPITHALTGVGLANLYKIQNKVTDSHLFRPVLMASIIGATSPDLDIVFRIESSMAYFQNHRGLSHSLPSMVIIALLTALLVKKFWPGLKVKTLFGIALVGAVSHVGLDLLTVYSTFALWPLKNTWYSGSILAIVEPLLIIFFLLGIYFAHKHPALHKKIWYGTFTLVILFIAFRSVSHYTLKSKLIDLYSGESKSVRVTVQPTFSLLAWDYIVNSDQKFYLGSVFLTKAKPVETDVFPIPKPDRYIKKAAQTKFGQFLYRFSPFIYATSKQKAGLVEVTLLDLRFYGRLRGLGAVYTFDADGNLKAFKFLNFE